MTPFRNGIDGIVRSCGLWRSGLAGTLVLRAQCYFAGTVLFCEHRGARCIIMKAAGRLDSRPSPIRYTFAFLVVKQNRNNRCIQA